jgi:hypothetical protein
MTGSAKQCSSQRDECGLLRRGVYHRAGRRPDPLAPRNEEESRRVGKAKRAHPRRQAKRVGTAQARLCPPYKAV